VNAINARKKETGVSAQLVKVNASQFQIVVSGPTGVANSVSLMGNSGELQFNAANAVQTATDAALTVDGLNLTRSTNQISDVLEGVTFDLKGLTSGAAQLNLSTDTAPLKEKITKLVSAYNDIQSVLTDAYNKDSKVAEYGASLVGDSTVQTIRAQLRSLVTANSSTTSGSVKALRDLGVSLDSSGQMTLDNAKLDNALANQYDDVVKMLSNNIKTDVTPSTGNGIANDGIKKITDLLSNTGILVSQSKNAAKRIDEYKEQLAKLNDRMTLLLARYNKQFSAMESIVGQSKSLQTSLTSSFEGMMATYTKN
jgi:flagellar hook-associated protein 2